MANKTQLVIIDKYKVLYETEAPNGVVISEQNLRPILQKLVSCRRRKLGKRATLAQIYETISIEDVLRNYGSVANLKSGIRENFDKPKKQAEDIRDIPITDDLEGYRPSEREFIQRRLCEYANDYKIEKSADKTLVMQTILYEMWMKQLNLRVPAEPKNFEELIKQIKMLNDMLSKNLSDLNALKKQVENPKNNKPVEEPTGNVGLSDALANLTPDDIIAEETERVAEAMQHLEQKGK